MSVGTTPPSNIASPRTAGELTRSLTFRDLVLYGLAYISPCAPLSTLGFVWQASNGLIALAYLLGAVCMYFTARSYATMTTAVPTAGSVYGFARHALGPGLGFMAGWMILLDYLLIPAFVYVLIAVAMGTLVPGVSRAVWICVLVSFTLGVNWFGVTVTSRANFVAVFLQVAVVVGLLALAVVALHTGKGTGALTLAPLFRASAFDVGKIFSATSICIMSFLGFDAISTLAEEVKGNDRRVVGRAILAVLVICAAFFVGVAWIMGNLLPGATIKDPAAAIYELAAWAFGPWAAITLAWSYATVVGFSNALPMQVGVARIVFAMGRDGQLPTGLAKVHRRYGTPYVSMLVTAAISLATALLARNELDGLATIINFGALCGFLFLHISVLAQFVIRERSRAWFAHWVVPACGILVVLAVLSGMSRVSVEVGLVWFAGGVAYQRFLAIRCREELHVPV